MLRGSRTSLPWSLVFPSFNSRKPHPTLDLEYCPCPQLPEALTLLSPYTTSLALSIIQGPLPSSDLARSLLHQFLDISSPLHLRPLHINIQSTSSRLSPFSILTSSSSFIHHLLRKSSTPHPLRIIISFDLETPDYFHLSSSTHHHPSHTHIFRDTTK
jgi:hypothetical protein